MRKSSGKQRQQCANAERAATPQKKLFYKRSTLLCNFGLQAVTTHPQEKIHVRMAAFTIELVARVSSSPVSSVFHASLCIEQSTQARSGECLDVGRARSRARVLSCQRQLSYPQAARHRAGSAICSSMTTEKPLHPCATSLQQRKLEWFPFDRICPAITWPCTSG